MAGLGRPTRPPPTSSSACVPTPARTSSGRRRACASTRVGASASGLSHARCSKYRARSVVVLALMVAQAFLFNAVFFSYGLVLSKFHGVAEEQTGLYLMTLAASNFLGPLLLGPLFDTVGRRKMIAGTYAAGDILLIATAIGFGLDAFTAWTQTFAWMLIFFFASAAASS